MQDCYNFQREKQNKNKYCFQEFAFQFSRPMTYLKEMLKMLLKLIKIRIFGLFIYKTLIFIQEKK